MNSPYLRLCLSFILAFLILRCGQKNKAIQTASFAILSKSFKQPDHHYASALAVVGVLHQQAVVALTSK